jgi:hypothetical protein
MAEDTELREFAERLIRLVRDRAIKECDQFAAGEIRGTRGERWRGIVVDASAHHALSALILDIVDQVLFEFLNAVDNDELPLGWRRTDGSFVALEEMGQGEMAGWLMGGEGGWLDDFSTQRFSNPPTGVTLKEDWDDLSGA